MRIRNEGEAIRNGIGYVPRDRKGQGLVIDFEVRENITLPMLRVFSRAGFINTASENTAAEKQIERLEIKTSSTRQSTNTLSGGNQQKVVIGRWIVASPRVLLLDYPTSGIDVRAKVEVYEILKELTDQGLSVILISPEYEETVTLCDRVLVMWRGRIVKEFLPEEFDEHEMLRHAIGSAVEEMIHGKV